MLLKEITYHHTNLSSYCFRCLKTCYNMQCTSISRTVAVPAFCVLQHAHVVRNLGQSARDVRDEAFIVEVGFGTASVFGSQQLYPPQ